MNRVKEFEDVVSVESILGQNELLVKLEPFFAADVQKIKKLRSRFTKLKKHGLSKIDIVQIQENEDNFVDNNRFIKHYFFDIDSTLTIGSPGHIENEIREIFQNMKDLEVRVYFSTGHSMEDVYQLMRNFPVRPQAIVENGGILIGYTDKGYDDVGDRTQPVRFVKFLMDNGYDVQEDINQMGRVTEMVLDKTSVLPRTEINRAQKTAAKQGIKVSILESQNSYHITQQGFNKGSALTDLSNRLKLGSYDEIISVGDSELDIPMFIKSHKGYLMGNATHGAKKNKPKNTKILKGKYIECIRNIYQDLAYFKLR